MKTAIITGVILLAVIGLVFGIFFLSKQETVQGSDGCGANWNSAEHSCVSKSDCASYFSGLGISSFPSGDFKDYRCNGNNCEVLYTGCQIAKV